MSKSAALKASYLDTSLVTRLSLINEIKVSKSAALKASYLDTSLVTRLSRLGGHTAVLERSSGVTAIRPWWPDCLFLLSWCKTGA